MIKGFCLYYQFCYNHKHKLDQIRGHQKMLNNTKSKGFTLVELLIVIVVIAILAAISIVAYNGIQNRGKATSGQNLASQIAKKAEAYNTVQSSYPTPAQLKATTSAVPEAQLDNIANVATYSTTAGNEGVVTVADNYSNGSKVIYRGAATGGCVYWWDYAASPAIQKSVGFGTVPSGC